MIPLPIDKRLLSYLLLSFLFLNQSFSQEKLEEKLHSFNTILGQEKVYVQTDRTFYKLGQSIWFSVYVLDESLLLSKKSKFIRVELIDPSGVVQQNFLLKYDSTNIVAGDFLIDKRERGGWYKLRVYTDWMEKTTQSYFEKEINIQSIVYSNILMELDFERETYGAGSTVRASLALKNLSNRAIQNKKVTYTVILGGKPIATASSKTDLEGKALVEFKLPVDLKTADGLINFKLEYQEIVESISRNIPIVLNQIELQFLPEGGNYVPELAQNVAFIAQDEFGFPVDVEGILRLGKDTVSLFRSYHQGMGSFVFSPKETAEAYTIEITEPAGMRTDLPFEWKSKKGNLSLNLVEQDKKELTVNLLATEEQEVSLCLQMQGKLPFYHRFKTKKGENRLAIPTDSLPIGIAQLTVFDANLQAQTERLVFVNQHKQLHIDIRTNKEQYQPDDEVQLSLDVRDQDSMPVQGNFSLAVVDEKNLTLADDKQHNILSQLLLSADLKGEIYEPSFYFDPKEPKADTALDYVLLTHGWRRFEWQNLLQEELIDWQQKIKKIEEKCFIKGLATVNDIPLRNQLVLLERKPRETSVVSKKRSIAWARTDDKGAFILEKEVLPFPSYLSSNYRGAWSSTLLRKGQAGIYTTKMIESDVRKPYVSTETADDYYYDNRSYYNNGRNNRRNRNRGSYGQSNSPSVEVSYDNVKDYSSAYSTHSVIECCDGNVQGRVQDTKTEEGLPFAVICLTQNDAVIYVTQTDYDGNYNISGVDSGTYELLVTWMGYKTYQEEFTLGNNMNKINVYMRSLDGLNAIVDADGNRGVITVTASIPRLDAISAGSALSINRSNLSLSRSLKSMTRSSKAALKTKLKRANKSINNASQIGLTKPKYTSYTNNLEQGRYGPTNRYNFLDDQMDWKASTSIRFELQEVKVLNYYRARTFAKFKKSRTSYQDDSKETVYWNPSIQTNAEGKANLSFYSSDVTSTFSIVVEGQGKGSLGRQEELYVTKDELEVQAKIPSLITVGDTLIFPVVLKNNTKKDIKGTFEVQMNSRKQVLGIYNLTIPAESYFTQEIPLVVAENIQKKSQVILHFYSKEYKEHSKYPIRVLKKGFPKEYGMSSNATLTQKTIQIDAPIKGSLEARFYAAPNPVDALSESILGITRVPSGCFEQVSAKNYPNVLALQYMDAKGIKAVEKRAKILEYLKMGYDKLVAYETDLGGFEWYGNTPPHLGLTAHGLLQFHEMQSVYDGVDVAMVQRVTQWILDTRDGEGGFNQEGGKYGFSSKNKLITRAYVLYALSAVDALGVEMELEAATKEVLESKDLYRLGLLTLSHWNYNNKQRARELLAILKAELWAKNLNKVTAQSSITNSYGRSLNIEILSIAMVAMLKVKPRKSSLLEACRKHILSQRQGGVFGNTQGTIWALKALVEYEKKYARKQASGEYALKINGKNVKTIYYNKDENGSINLDDLATHFQQGENTIEVSCKTIKGEVPAYSLDVNWMELLPEKNTNCVIGISTEIASTNPSIGEIVRLTAHLKNKSNEAQASTVALIGIPTGLSLQAWQLKDLQAQKKVDYIELMEGYVVLHYRDLEPNEEHLIHLDLKTEFVGRSQASSSCAYLYYQNEFKDWCAGSILEVLP
jgi:hypothetical protein